MEDVLTWPVGRDKDYNPPALPIVAYALSSTVAATMVALSIGAVGALARTIGMPVSGLIVIGATALVGLAVSLQWKGRLHPLVERRKQVPRWWLLWRHRWLTAAAFGLMIGAGILTHIKHATAYVLVAMALLAPSMAVSAAIGASYGMWRAVPLVVTWLRDRRSKPRPAWPGVGPAAHALNRGLAVTATVSFAGMLVLLLGGGLK